MRESGPYIVCVQLRPCSTSVFTQSNQDLRGPLIEPLHTAELLKHREDPVSSPGTNVINPYLRNCRR